MVYCWGKLIVHMWLTLCTLLVLTLAKIACVDDYHNGQYTYNWLASYLRRAQCQWKFYMPLATNVDVNHQITCIFQMYSEGSTAVKQDNETAFQWFKKAADAVSE